jgi:hypothetical protein
MEAPPAISGDLAEEAKPCLSDNKPIEQLYHNGFELDLSGNLHKSVSFCNAQLPKFELDNFDQNEERIDENLIKEEVGDMISLKKHAPIGTIHESEGNHFLLF